MQKFGTALAALILFAAGLAACSGGVSSDELEELERQAAASAEAARRAQVIAALEPLNPLGYHHFDGIIRNEARIPSEALVWALRAEQSLDWVEWPHELRPHVEQYSEWLASLIAAMRDGGAEAAVEPSRITHALAHHFEASAIAWLEGRSVPEPPALEGLEPPQHGGGHDDDTDGHAGSDTGDHDDSHDSSNAGDHD